MSSMCLNCLLSEEWYQLQYYQQLSRGVEIQHGMGHRSLRICDVFSGIWGPATVLLSSVLNLKFRWVVNLLNLSLLLSGGCLFFCFVYLPNFHHSILLSIVKVNDLLYEQLYRFKWVIITSVHFFFFFLMYWIMQGP